MVMLLELLIIYEYKKYDKHPLFFPLAILVEIRKTICTKIRIKAFLSTRSEVSQGFCGGTNMFVWQDKDRGLKIAL